MGKTKESKKQEFNANEIFFKLEEEQIRISKRKYESIIEELAYLRAIKISVKDNFVSMSLEEYTELILIKGKYEELKAKKVLNINKDGIQIPT